MIVHVAVSIDLFIYLLTLQHHYNSDRKIGQFWGQPDRKISLFWQHMSYSWSNFDKIDLLFDLFCNNVAQLKNKGDEHVFINQKDIKTR